MRSAALGLLLIVAGCSSQATDIYHDPTFTQESLATGGLAVVGVVALAGEDDDGIRAIESELVHRALREERPKLRSVAPRDIWIALGLDSAAHLLDRYRMSGRLSPADIDTLHYARSLARYGLLARIDLDVVVRDHELSEEELAGRTTYLVEPIVKRELGVTFDIVDLDDGRTLWSLALRRVDQERGDPIRHEPLQSQVTESDLVNAIRDILAREEGPPPPSRQEGLARLYRDFVRRLPGARS